MSLRGMKQAITFPAFFLTRESVSGVACLPTPYSNDRNHGNAGPQDAPQPVKRSLLRPSLTLGPSRRVHPRPPGDALGADHPLDQYDPRESDRHRLELLARRVWRVLHPGSELVSEAGD
jgi:hypothetical protein